jgi:ABC-type transport system involved in multi-copper enzyme maturation permease subunit/regulation of enolase protein 1 (concanavalin A-like superfamily)
MNAFLHLLRAEWTKFRTVRGWVIGMLAGAAVIVGLGLLPGRQGSCGQHGPESECVLPVGPEGQEVTDSLTFVHQPLAGDGSITVRISSMTGDLPSDGPQSRAGVAPWAKAGLIIKDGIRPGSAYAAVMITGEHGVRMQSDYVHDTAGKPGAVSTAGPRWLRLTRTGETITAAESPDGSAWTTVGTARLKGLPATVEAGLFVTSPQYSELVNESVVLSGTMGGPSQATAAFDHISREGTWSSPTWTGTTIGGDGGSDPGADPGSSGVGPGPSGGAGPAPKVRRSGFAQTADGFTVTGSGDIAPAVSGASGLGVAVSQTLIGTFVGLLVVVVVGAMFITAEFRRGLIRTTMTASPRRGRILAAKAVVLGGVTFVVGLVAAAVVVTFGQGVLRDNGVYVHPVSTATELRVIAGTATLLAACAVLALGLGALLRRSVTAVTAAIVVVVLPYLLSVTVLPLGAAQWLLRVSPAAAFALQQTEAQYAQIDNVYSPADGYFPLPAWAGFAVLAAWAALALTGATLMLRRRDA